MPPLIKSAKRENWEQGAETVGVLVRLEVPVHDAIVV